VKKNVVVTAAAVLMVAVIAEPGNAQTAQGQTAPASPAPVVAPIPKTQPFVTPGARVDLSIEEAVARARDKNIDIAVARITPRLTDFSIAALDANYRVNLTSSANNARVSTLPSQTTSEGRSPVAAPTTTGTSAAPTADTGATTPIRPRENPR